MRTPSWTRGVRFLYQYSNKFLHDFLFHWGCSAKAMFELIAKCFFLNTCTTSVLGQNDWAGFVVWDFVGVCFDVGFGLICLTHLVKQKTS